MGVESHARLIEAIQRFLVDAEPAMERFFEDLRAKGLERGHGGRPRPSFQALAQSLADLPTCIEVNALARKASLAADYLLPEPAGRRLDADTLISTGLLTTVSGLSGTDLQTVARDLAGYLAGPPVGIWDYAILDGYGTLQDSIRSWMGGNW